MSESEAGSVEVLRKSEHETILDGARRIAPLIRDQAAAAEAACRLTDPVVNALRESGVFRMSMPRAWGGPELEFVQQIEIVEVLAQADASAGWCAMICSDSGFYAAMLDDAPALSLYKNLDFVTAGLLLPVGRLETVNGGYRLSGRWSFGSGSSHADVFAAGALVTKDGAIVPDSNGQPQWRIALLPADQVQVHEGTWHTTGLSGSGSNDYSVDNVFVDHDYTFKLGETRRPETLYRWRGAYITNFVGVPLGVAAGALGSATEALVDKVVDPAGALARDQPRAQAALGRAQAMVGSARSYAYDIFGQLWSTLDRGDEPTYALRAAIAGCLVHTTAACLDAVRLLVETVGTAGIRRGSPLERNLRDLITIRQHILGQDKMAEWAGALQFGKSVDFPIL
ncbi:acyl-CoA dehydrogenase family protein [Pseudonocardia spinosispora]|uniref:acyl-CoA dehydrogenase family protein n=1 Tax=Pseudonocardia spinosispora TaxID=103441 RepID=UPI00146FB675|nr:acyl-CoA dehydrogenase family protein [Pseudonocardia spinosispora]